MAGAPKFDAARIIVSPGRIDRNAHWEFSGRVSHGIMHHYAALDGNLPAPVPWWFLLHAPAGQKKGEYVLLQAIDYPRRRPWTPLARTVINFAKATMPKYRGMLYAKIRLADPLGAGKYEAVGWKHHDALPPYLKAFTLRRKRQVATTRGKDGDSLVAVVPRDDHAQMIRLFFATKAWPLHAGLPAATRRALSKTT
jgi:hypothetical protein